MSGLSLHYSNHGTLTITMSTHIEEWTSQNVNSAAEMILSMMPAGFRSPFRFNIKDTTLSPHDSNFTENEHHILKKIQNNILDHNEHSDITTVKGPDGILGLSLNDGDTSVSLAIPLKGHYFIFTNHDAKKSHGWRLTMSL